ncbi:MAG TPA: hypothetical protein VKB37_04060, partial [Jatrophihabitantaceae bacterium]|nr:hypothetical protein [Jatrophihabitantaceae bacterium]
MSWVAHYWAQAGGNPPAIVAYAPFWLYGTAVTALNASLWASSYVTGLGITTICTPAMTPRGGSKSPVTRQ